eukprot:Gb_24335 [translate_table: standard]
MTACYLINRSPSSTLGDKTPHEVWCGKKPSLRHLRVFGCEAYVHVPKEKRTKLDYKAQKCIFVGYGDGIKGYKCWNPESQKIEGKVEKYKTCLVAKGYSQVEGIDFNEIFSPIVKITSIRFILAVATAFDLKIEQMDVKTAFLHGDLEGKIYMSHPEGFEVKGNENLVCRLKKSLYGLKQSPRMWYQKFHTHMLGLGFIRITDHGIYFKQVRDHFVILLLYVDDILLIGNNKEMIKAVKSQLSSQFEMKDLGAANFILDCKPVNTPIPISFKLSAEQCPKTQEDIEDMSHVPYASAVGSLMYAMVYSKLDIAHAVGVVSRYISNLGKEHWTIVKRIFRYLRGTSNFGICYQGRLGQNITVDVQGFVDVDWAGDLNCRRSTSGYVFNLFGGAVSWMSKRKASVVLSSTEVEYMATTHACKEEVWL